MKVINNLIEDQSGFSIWSKQLSAEMKKYPLIKNKWKMSKFERMYKDGFTVSEAFQCWFCAH